MFAHGVGMALHSFPWHSQELEHLWGMIRVWSRFRCKTAQIEMRTLRLSLPPWPPVVSVVFLFCFFGRVLPLFLSMCFTLDVRKREIKAVDLK